MKKIVVSGSASLQPKIKELLEKLKHNYNVLDYPKAISEESFLNDYPQIHKNFYNNIANTDVLLIFNEDKNGVVGHIGAAGFAELAFGLAQNLLYKKNIELFVYKMPSDAVACYDEVKLWLELGWIKLWQ